jgi:hypothetical protein
VDTLTQAKVEHSENKVDYLEAAGLKATFGWDDDLVVNGRKIPLVYERFDTPYVRTKRGEQVYRIACGGKSHVVDLASLQVKPFRDIK